VILCLFFRYGHGVIGRFVMRSIDDVFRSAFNGTWLKL
jgi:hypothetical protein